MLLTYPLPLSPFHRTTGFNLRPVIAASMQRSAIGFPVSPLDGMGDHWAVEVDPLAMGTECGRRLLSKLVRGPRRRVRVPIPQRGFDIGQPGGLRAVPHGDGAFFSDVTGYAPIRPRVDGSGQSGSTLRMIGATPGYVVREGLFFTLETRFGSSAHIVTEDAVTDDAGRVEVAFWPMLWRDPADGDHVEMFEPYIEGLVVDQGGQASVGFPAVTTDPFTVEEAG